MDRSDLSLPVVDPEHTGANSDSVQQSIFMSIHPARSDNSCCWERIYNSLFSFELGSVVGRGGIGRGVKMGNVNEAGHAGLMGDSSYSSSSGDVNIVEIEVSKQFGGRLVI